MSMKARRLYLVLRIPARDVLNLTDEVKRKLANRSNVKTLKVLNDFLADKRPNLQDLKDAQGDLSPTTTTSAVAKSD